MTTISIAGFGTVRAAPLAKLDASSSTGIEVERWAGSQARLSRMDRLCALGVAACNAALCDAGLSPNDPDWNGERTGVVLGTAYGSHATNEAYYRGYLADPASASPRLFAYTLPSSPVGEICIHLRILGPASTTISGACAALDALAEGLRHLDAERVDRLLVAATDVATPLLERLALPMRADCGSALVLARGGEVQLRCSARFADRDPRAAVRRLPPELIRVETVYASASILPALGDVATHNVLEEGLGANAPLLAIRRFLDGDAKSALIVAADPCGQVSALRLERIS
jgi:hypothetical protein